MTIQEHIEKLTKAVEYDKTLFARFPNNTEAVTKRLQEHEQQLHRYITKLAEKNAKEVRTA